MTPAEAAEALHHSHRTLANWRSKGIGPAYRKIGNRVDYLRESVLGFSSEIGASRRSKPHVTITLRPYPRDRTRFQVDIQTTHPATGEPIRSRPVAPRGMDEAAAAAWAEKEKEKIFRKLFKQAAKVQVEPEEEKPKKNKEEKKTSKASTLDELWAKYEAEVLLDSEKTRPRTWISYEKLWRTIKDIVGAVRCDAWTKEHEGRLAARFKASGAKHANKAVTLVSNLFKVAVEDREIAEVPRLARRKVKKKLKPSAHNADDLDLLLAAARGLGAERGEAIELMILLGLDAGLRPGEVAGLRWHDIDWSANQLMIQNQRPQKMGMEDHPIKYDEVGRIGMTTRLRVALEVHRARGGHGRFVFVSSHTGQPLYTNLVSDRIAEVHDRAGLARKRAHFMRHCAATRVALHPKGSVAAANGLLRHKSLTTTELYISEIRGSEPSRQAVAILDLLNEGEGETGTTLAPAGTSRPGGRVDLN
ncbi:tyrosine-type recombinase/integrase [Nannocystis sp. SCPEA4]|uniref:tyrosine-type recombinase/integrase n=1 Tax=Nannocystis sp. SCPEA4 TaxID=2996787 RepID=UPI00227217BB|nr:tyrosine-type recombinase/integrase [Nannocystis sp. SCPEA4]MCY1055446.1 tyrosine-type recombinase/integrase [Nannocystis sp. SCPEA4]